MGKKTNKNKNKKNAIQIEASPRELVGSEDMSFLNVLFNDLISNMWLPEGVSEEQIALKIDSAKEALRQIAPQDGVEGMLAIQMASTHQAAMECLKRAAIQDQTFEGRNMALKHGEKLLRLYMDQVKALSKHRGKGDQKMVIEHVNVEPGGQAIVGQVENKPHQKDKNDT